jgi:multidrug transporter EmrE-like cation transporter
LTLIGLITRWFSSGDPLLIKLLILLVTVNTVASQLLLKRAVTDIGGPATLAAFPGFIAAAATSPWVYASLGLQVIGYVLWMVVISHEKLGISIAILGGGFYCLMAFSTWIVYGEELTAIQWMGIGLITAGVGCLTLRQA